MSIAIKICAVVLALVVLILLVVAAFIPAKRKPSVMTPDPSDAIALRRSQLAKRNEIFTDRLWKQLDLEERARRLVPASMARLQASTQRLANCLEASHATR